MTRSEVSSSAFARSFEGLTGAHSSTGNSATVLVNGDQIFPAMIDAIRGARRSVNLLTFVYWSGAIAKEFADVICDRASLGVPCRVLLDAYGAKQLDAALIDAMESAGAIVKWFRPLDVVPLNRLNGRNHRKILVVDGRLGFTGGVGIAEEWTGNAQDEDHWRETHVRLAGPVVRGLQGAFAESWAEASSEILAGDAHYPELAADPDGVLMHVVRSTGGEGPSNAALAFQMALGAAQGSLKITSAYFSPDDASQAALTAAARRGVEVQVVVPGPHADKRIAKAAGRSMYRAMIESGIQLFEYQPTMIHAKTVVVDGRWSMIGSVNVDSRSMTINVEAAVCINCETIASELGAIFETDLAASERMEASASSPKEIVDAACQTIGWALRRQL